MSDPRTQQYCTFHLADLYMGIPAGFVQEMIHTTTRTSVPLVSPVVQGLVNLRGEIVTSIDLRRRLGIARAEPTDGGDVTSTNVVIRSGDTVVCLVVDSIGDVLTVEGSSFEPVPTQLNQHCRDVVEGVYKLDGQLLLALNLNRLLDVSSIVGSRELVNS